MEGFAGGTAAGTVADSPTPRGYLYISIVRRVYSGGRLAWLYVTGKWPVHEISYINRDRTDIRWTNLREATRSQNSARHRAKNKLGARGIWLSKSDTYVAQIRLMGKLRYLGSFDAVGEAKAAYEKAAKELSENLRRHCDDPYKGRQSAKAVYESADSQDREPLRQSAGPSRPARSIAIQRFLIMMVS